MAYSYLFGRFENFATLGFSGSNSVTWMFAWKRPDGFSGHRAELCRGLKLQQLAAGHFMVPLLRSEWPRLGTQRWRKCGLDHMVEVQLNPRALGIGCQDIYLRVQMVMQLQTMNTCSRSPVL